AARVSDLPAGPDAMGSDLPSHRDDGCGNLGPFGLGDLLSQGWGELLAALCDERAGWGGAARRVALPGERPRPGRLQGRTGNGLRLLSGPGRSARGPLDTGASALPAAGRAP